MIYYEDVVFRQSCYLYTNISEMILILLFFDNILDIRLKHFKIPATERESFEIFVCSN